MSTSEPTSKITIGFHGGQVLQARIKGDQLAQLRGALGQTGGFHELTAEAGTVVFDLTRVDYLLIDDERSRVGF